MSQCFASHPRAGGGSCAAAAGERGGEERGAAVGDDAAYDPPSRVTPRAGSEQETSTIRFWCVRGWVGVGVCLSLSLCECVCVCPLLSLAHPLR